jgi:hypothetical protein
MGDVVYLRRQPTLEAVAKQLVGLRPIIDPVLELVRCECPECHAGMRDPHGMYRPLVVIPRRDVTLYRCDACGVEEVRRLAA